MKQKQTVPRLKHWQVIALAIIVLAVAGQIAIDIWARASLERKSSDAAISQLIMMSVNNLYKPAAVDAKTGTVYMPEAKLMMPAIQSPGNQILYSYNTTDKTDPELTVTTNNLVHQGEAKLLAVPSGMARATDADKLSAMFAQVPSLQACARGIQLYPRTQSTANSSLKLALTLQPKNDRTLYGYKDDGCHEDMSPLTSELQQAQSY